MHVQKALGYSLTGITTEQKAWMGTGAGSNGKGTIFNAIRNCLGDYAYQMPFSTLLHTHHPTGSNDLAALDGKRFVLASEVNEGLRFDEARVKALTGCDPITARFLYAEYFTFRPVAKFWLSTNHKPIVKDDSHAFWRRIHLVPFLRTFPVNPDLEDALAAEAVGILAWLIRGCLLWQAEGLGVPQVIAEATQTYQRDSDVLGDFIETCCKSDETAEISGAELYKAYTAWAERQGLTERERLTSTMFGRKASERLPRGRTSRGARYRVRVTGFSSEMTG
jgi:putative DNA primase/helicase